MKFNLYFMEGYLLQVKMISCFPSSADNEC